MGTTGQDGQEKAAGCAGGATPRDIALVRAGLEAAIRSIDDHRYGMPGREAEWSRLIMRRLADLDPAAIAAGVPECLSAMEQVALDLHDALGVKWGDDPYAAISALRARVEELSDKALRFDLDQAGITAREREAVELVELRARVAELQLQLAIAEEALARKPVRGD